MRGNWEKSLKFTLTYEGGYVYRADDRGGATNKGITQATYNAWRKSQGVPVQHVKNITDFEVTDIYKKEYWDKVSGDELPYNVDSLVFDFAVNSGVKRSIRFLQRCLNVHSDGVLGPITLAAAKRADEQDLCKCLVNARGSFIERLGRTSYGKTFIDGWRRRINALKALVGI